MKLIKNQYLMLTTRYHEKKQVICEKLTLFSENTATLLIQYTLQYSRAELTMVVSQVIALNKFFSVFNQKYS